MLESRDAGHILEAFCVAIQIVITFLVSLKFHVFPDREREEAKMTSREACKRFQINGTDANTSIRRWSQGYTSKVKGLFTS